MSRRRTERLVGHGARAATTGPCAVRACCASGLDFGRRNPLTCVRDLLKTCGFADEHEARDAIALPLEPCICRPDAAPSRTPVDVARGQTTRCTRRWCWGSAPVALRPGPAGALDAHEPHASTRTVRRTGVLRMNAGEFHNIYQELIEENPLAIRAVLKVLRIEFTDTVPTLAVTCEARPRLLVNLAFVGEHCRTEAHVKAVICHEFLHVLLRHTERFTTLTPAEHLALDAVINAIIHRSLGPGLQRDDEPLLRRASVGIARLLRPPTAEEQERIDTPAGAAGAGARASGARGLGRPLRGHARGRRHSRSRARSLHAADRRPTAALLGNHDALARTEHVHARPATASTGALADALDTALKAMNGSGVFRSPNGRGVGADAYRNEVRGRRHRGGPMAAGDLRRAAASPAPRPAVRRPGAVAAELHAAGALARRSARGAAVAVEPVSPRRAMGDRAHRARRIGPRLSRRQRLHERGDAAHRRAARATDAVHPPAVLGVQQRRRAGAHRAGPAHRRHDGRHQHGLRARARGAHQAAAPRSSSPTATSNRSARRRWPPRPARACTSSSRAMATPRCCSAPACPTPSSRGCRHDPHERSRAAGPPGQVLRPGRRRHRRRVLQGRSARLLPGGDERLVRPGLPHRRHRHAQAAGARSGRHRARHRAAHRLRGAQRHRRRSLPGARHRLPAPRGPADVDRSRQRPVHRHRLGGLRREGRLAAARALPRAPARRGARRAVARTAG